MRRSIIKGNWQKASYTVEAAIYIPIILLVLCQTLETGIDFWQRSKMRESNKHLQELDIVQEFYNYQIMEEIGKEIIDD